MNPAFSDPAAKARWDDYNARVTRLVERAGSEAAGLDLDLRSHLAESFAAETGTEAERLERAITRLGDPADYLRPLLSDALIARGGETYDPLTISRGLYHALRSGSARALRGGLFALGYAVLAILAVMSVLKPFFADSIGLVRGADGSLTFGITGAGGEELLGFWSIPLTLALCALLYVLLTRRLRRWR